MVTLAGGSLPVKVPDPSRDVPLPIAEIMRVPAQEPAAASRPSSSPARWGALDAFRGLAVIGMLLVNNPGDRDAVYRQLEHSLWNGCTVADLVFPFFLFVVGITTAITIARVAPSSDGAMRRRIWRRSAIIFGVGLLLNWF